MDTAPSHSRRFCGVPGTPSHLWSLEPKWLLNRPGSWQDADEWELPLQVREVFKGLWFLKEDWVHLPPSSFSSMVSRELWRQLSPWRELCLLLVPSFLLPGHLGGEVVVWVFSSSSFVFLWLLQAFSFSAYSRLLFPLLLPTHLHTHCNLY